MFRIFYASVFDSLIISKILVKNSSAGLDPFVNLLMTGNAITATSWETINSWTEPIVILIPRLHITVLATPPNAAGYVKPTALHAAAPLNNRNHKKLVEKCQFSIIGNLNIIILLKPNY